MQRLKILIVEDDFELSTYIKMLLLKVGYSVTDTVSSGKEAIKSFYNIKPDLIIMDINLEGDMDGVQIAESILEKEFVDIIYLTSLKDKISYERAKNTNPKFFLNKPFNKYQLLDIIDDVGRLYELNLINTESFKSEFFFKKNRLGVYQKYQTKDIQYVKADGSYSEIFLSNTNTSLKLSINLKSLLLKLNCPNLIRINRKFAINIKLIDKIQENSVLLEQVKHPPFIISNSFNFAFFKRIKKI